MRTVGNSLHSKQGGAQGTPHWNEDFNGRREGSEPRDYLGKAFQAEGRTCAKTPKWGSTGCVWGTAVRAAQPELGA